MKYAAKIDAEPGWYALLSRDDGSIVAVEIKEWGVAYTNGIAMIIPIDTSTGQSILHRDNFLQLIDPNEYTDIPAHIESLMREREARKLAGAAI